MQPYQVVVLLPFVVTATLAAAQEVQVTSPLVKGVIDCRMITDGQERLTCFDKTSAALAEATGRKEVMVISRDEITKTRQSLFGFDLPRLPLFGEDRNGEDEFTVLETAIEQVRSDDRGRFTLMLSGGAVWQTTEPPRSLPKPGHKVRIRKAALGSFFMNINGGLAVRAQRIS